MESWRLNFGECFVLANASPHTGTVLCRYCPIHVMPSLENCEVDQDRIYKVGGQSCFLVWLFSPDNY